MLRSKVTMKLFLSRGTLYRSRSHDDAGNYTILQPIAFTLFPTHANGELMKMYILVDILQDYTIFMR